MADLTVYVVGRVLKVALGLVAWELLGVYQDQSMAIAACKKTNDFYAPVLANVPLVVSQTPIEGGIFPLAVVT